DGDVQGYTGSVDVWAFTFQGFAAPVSNAPAVNVAKAGQVIPLRFTVVEPTGTPVTDVSPSLAPVVSQTACDSHAPSHTVDVATTVGLPGLKQLSPGSYQFNWAVPKSYAGTCQTLQLTLADGVPHTALFKFSR